MQKFELLYSYYRNYLIILCSVIFLFLFHQPTRAFENDRVITGQELQNYSRTDFWTALAIAEPSVNGGFLSKSLIVIDGARMPVNTIRGLSIYAIDKVRVVKDPITLSKYGINAANGVIEIFTHFPSESNMKVDYILDARLAKGDRCAFQNQSELNVEESDGAIGYLFNGNVAPGNKEVNYGEQSDAFGLRTFVEYGHKSLSLRNDIKYNYINDNLENYDEVGSEIKNKSNILSDHFNVGVNLMDNLKLNGYFCFVHQMLRTDNFLSPSSPVFSNSSDVRLNGTYHILRGSTTTLEVGASCVFDKFWNQHRVSIEGSGVVYSGRNRSEDYGGRGIMTNRLNHISFTQSYDTLSNPLAIRDYEHTFQGNVSVCYNYAGRYEASILGNWNRSSLLATEKKNVVYMSGIIQWNMETESWFKKYPIDILHIWAGVGTSGIVNFMQSDFLTQYSNNIGNEYIYNYYQVGASIKEMANPSLEPTKLTKAVIGLDLGIAPANIHAEYYHNSYTGILGYETLPLALGFSQILTNCHSCTHEGVEIRMNSAIMRKSNCFLNGTFHMLYDRCADDKTFRSLLALNAGFYKFNISTAFNQLKFSSLQLGYNFKFNKGLIEKLDLCALIEDVNKWQNANLYNGVTLPENYIYTVSAKMNF